jgi:hypothetical protein
MWMNDSSSESSDQSGFSDSSERVDGGAYTNDTGDDDSKRDASSRKIGTLDNGTTAFMRWLDSVNKNNEPSGSSDIPITLKKFIKDKRTILYDKNLESEIDIEIKEGIPFCRNCDLNDCVHVGFTISLEQMCEDRASGQELSVDDIVGD